MVFSECMRKLCKATNQWGLYLSTFEPDGMETDTFLKELPLAAPGLLDENYHELFLEGRIVLMFANQEECNAVYGNVIGDDGPTDTNEYDGDVRVYALTCDNEGSLRNENT